LTVAVRPPECFPRPAYAALLLFADVVVLADTFAYSRQGHQNRYRIRTAEPVGARPGAGRQWLTVPLAGSSGGRPLREVAVAEDGRWRRVHRKTLRHHYGSAPFYTHYGPELDALLDAPAPSLAAFTGPTVAWTARALRAPARVVAASALPGAPADVASVLAATGATALLTLPESAASDALQAGGRAVRVLALEEGPRRQNFPGFAAGCSALDAILNHGPEDGCAVRGGR